MKKILLPILFSIFSTALYSQWNTLTLNSSNTLTHCTFPTDDTGYVTSGKIYRTFNGGLNFDSISVPTMGQYNNINFRKGLDGVVCGYMLPSGPGIFRTLNAGQTWVNITATNAVGTPLDVRFADAIHGTCLTSAPGLLNTANAGLTWDTVTFGYDYFNSLDYPTTTTGYVGGFDGTFNYSGVICKTTDAGVTWNVINNFNESNTDILQLQFVNADTGFLSLTTYTQPARFLRTRDGAVSFDTVYFNNGQISKFAFSDYMHGFIVNDSGSIYRTTDAGVTWSLDHLHYISLADINSTSNFAYSVGSAGYIIKRNILSGISFFQNNSQINVFPNPGDNKVTIQLSFGTEVVSVSAIDITGRNCGNISFENESENKIVLDTHSLDNGFYILEVVTKNEILKVKFEMSR